MANLAEYSIDSMYYASNVVYGCAGARATSVEYNALGYYLQNVNTNTRAAFNYLFAGTY